jgi:hypothetical protein
MMQERRCWAVTLRKDGKLELKGFFSQTERKAICEVKENHTRPITMKQWREIPKDMKA